MLTRSILSLSICLAVLSTAGCSRAYNFSGIVVDGDGLPIAGASFAIQPHDWNEPDWFDPKQLSGDDGRFSTGWGSAVGVEFFKFTTAKEGFDNDVRLVEADATDIRIVLSRTRKGG
jgi:hypothetical protein